MDNIVHVGSCKNSDCLILACREMKESFEHVQQCNVLDISLCGTCSSFTLDALRHSKTCQTNGCSAPLCEKLKNIRIELNGLEKLNTKCSTKEGSASTEESSASTEEGSASENDSIEEQDNKIKVNPKPSSSESACQGLHAGVCTLERRLRLFCYSSNLSDSQEDGNSTDMDEKSNEDSTLDDLRTS
ncbi:hypothetical protein NPIL_307891 [Nephila pilipes]|uniref:TAZ-type domain-containing protein n=1 Tax=Nephila pilipes TaxID=299642 RepID=A0A8X6MLU0_NEPPI|nr:hypothetical protein NPIL_623161 [Nephila pilipes]GFT68695.1 hypothetical protein NPIL_307891 [Nephila pilipes]